MYLITFLPKKVKFKDAVFEMLASAFKITSKY